MLDLDLICTRLERDARIHAEGQTRSGMSAHLRTREEREPITEIDIQAPNAKAFADLAVGKVYTLSLTLSEDQMPISRLEQELYDVQKPVIRKQELWR